MGRPNLSKGAGWTGVGSEIPEALDVPGSMGSSELGHQ